MQERGIVIFFTYPILSVFRCAVASRKEGVSVRRSVRRSVRNAFSQTPARRILRRIFGLVFLNTTLLCPLLIYPFKHQGFLERRKWMLKVPRHHYSALDEESIENCLDALTVQCFQSDSKSWCEMKVLKRIVITFSRVVKSRKLESLQWNESLYGEDSGNDIRRLIN